MPNHAVQIRPRSARVHVEDLEVVDTFFFGGPDEVPATISFDITWLPTGAPRVLTPESDDPLGPTYFVGIFRDAVAEGSFSAESITEPGGGPFSFTDAFATSEPVWGEMGFEANGVFIEGGGGDHLTPTQVENEARRALGLVELTH